LAKGKERDREKRGKGEEGTWEGGPGERRPRVLKEPEAKWRRRPWRAAASRSATTARRSGRGCEMPEEAKKPCPVLPQLLDEGGPRIGWETLWAYLFARPDGKEAHE